MQKLWDLFKCPDLLLPESAPAIVSPFVNDEFSTPAIYFLTKICLSSVVWEMCALQNLYSRIMSQGMDKKKSLADQQLELIHHTFYVGFVYEQIESKKVLDLKNKNLVM